MSDEPKPLTDEDLSHLVYLADQGEVEVYDLAKRGGALLERRFEPVSVKADVLASLVAEVRRFRMPPAVAEYWELDALDKLNPRTEAGLRTAKGLIAEVRRLRSDEWLHAAFREIDTAYASGGDPPRADVLAILRKHRDGKA